MRDVLDDIRARGAELVGLGSGSPEEAKGFVEELGLSFPIYTDPSVESYQCADLPRGLTSTFRPRVLKHGLLALKQGFRQTRTQGSALQQGGAFVIARGGALLFEHRSREAGDHPDPKALVEALAGPLAGPLAEGAT